MRRVARQGLRAAVGFAAALALPPAEAAMAEERLRLIGLAARERLARPAARLRRPG